MSPNVGYNFDFWTNNVARRHLVVETGREKRRLKEKKERNQFSEGYMKSGCSYFGVIQAAGHSLSAILGGNMASNLYGRRRKHKGKVDSFHSFAKTISGRWSRSNIAPLQARPGLRSLTTNQETESCYRHLRRLHSHAHTMNKVAPTRTIGTNHTLSTNKVKELGYSSISSTCATCAFQSLVRFGLEWARSGYQLPHGANENKAKLKENNSEVNRPSKN